MTSPIIPQILRFGIISQTTPTLNTVSLFNSLFAYIKPKSYQIKSEHHLEYTPANLPSLTVILKQINSIDKLYEIIATFNTFLLMADIQKENSLKELSSMIDSVLEASDYETQKVYIFGFYQGPLAKENKEDKFTKMIDAKGIDYEYFELDVRDVEEFAKVIDYLVKETMDNDVNIKKDGKHSDVYIGFDASKSRCILF